MPMDVVRRGQQSDGLLRYEHAGQLRLEGADIQTMSVARAQWVEAAMVAKDYQGHYELPRGTLWQAA